MANFTNTALPPIVRLGSSADAAYNIHAGTALLPNGLAEGSFPLHADHGLRGDVAPMAEKERGQEPEPDEDTAT